MARALPLWPFILFGIIEPALLLWALYTGLQDPYKFYMDQVPDVSTTASIAWTPQAQLLVQLLLNVYLLLALLAVVCCWTSHKSTAVWYLYAVALADLGHIFAVYRIFGPEKFGNLSGWNDMTWGNVGVSVFLHLNRLATVFGLFGRIGK